MPQGGFFAALRQKNVRPYAAGIWFFPPGLCIMEATNLQEKGRMIFMRKKLVSLALAIALALTLVPAASAAPAGIAKASTQSVEVDGQSVQFQMYALESDGGLTNYVKLRDVAHVLSGTPAKFSVGYDGVISITTGADYTDNGSEMTTPYSGDRAYQPGPGSVKVNGADVTLDAIVLTDDGGGAYTYFKLRDLGTALGFKVDWSGERGVFIETGAEAAPAVPTETGPTIEDFAGAWVDALGDEWIFSGNTVQNFSKLDDKIYYNSGTAVLKKDAFLGQGSTKYPYIIELHWDTHGTNGSAEPDEEGSDRVGYITIKKLDLENGTFIRPGIYVDETTRRIGASPLKSEWDAQAKKLNEQGEAVSKYPTYADWPGVPDFGAIYGVSMEESHTTSGMIVCSYDYDEVTKRAIELFGNGNVKPYEEANMLMRLKDDYYRILAECGYEEKLVKNVFGDRILVNMNEALGYRVDVDTLSYAHEYKDWTFKIYIQPLK